MPDADFDLFKRKLEIQFAQLPQAVLHHYSRLYGTRTALLLEGVSSPEQLGRHFGSYLYEVEVRYLVRYEWARSARDILERRTKHGVHLDSEQWHTFEEWFSEHYLQLTHA